MALPQCGSWAVNCSPPDQRLGAVIRCRACGQESRGESALTTPGGKLRRNRVAATATASLLAAATALSLSTPQAGAVSAANGSDSSASPTSTGDSLTTAWRAKYDAVREAAVQQRLRTGGKGTTEKLGSGVHGRVARP